jgi:glycyl-tRNA synthetase beta chain
MTPTEKNKKELVFEIGTEELPATNLADLFESLPGDDGTDNALLDKWKKAFRDYRITYGGANVLATPRRIVFCLSDVAPAQEKNDQLTRLMTKSEAYGADSKPTEKFLAILKHRNVDLRDTVVVDSGQKETVFIKKAQPARKTVSVLPELLETFVKSLTFPKTMKWDDSGIYFPRPIRHTLCFFGNDVIHFKIGRTKSSERVWVFSRGKRTSFAASDAAAYFRILKKQGVILSPQERKTTIQAILEKLAKTYHARLHEDPFLLNEVNFLVENPQGIAAPFAAEFLILPLEVLIVSMARKQRIFGLVDKDGRVEPRFLAILDGAASEKDKKIICKNYENILHAKLQDSLFFYKEDLKTPLEKKREELKTLIFLKDAGTMLEKSDRLVSLAKQFKEEMGLRPDEPAALERACYLSKADLLTHMVGEFPELQGVIGKYYALENGESASVAQAIGEQYLPRTVNDKLPETPLGSCLSLLDKCDLIAVCFGLGLEPTSSLDPYGLRRSATGILKIILNRKIEISLDKLLAEADRAAGEAIVTSRQKKSLDPRERAISLKAFFKDRFKALLVDRGYRSDLVEAVMASCFDSPHEAYRRVHALSLFAQENAFLNACKIVERTHNILKGTDPKSLPLAPDQALFVEPLEHALAEKLYLREGAIAGAKKEGDFARATSLYAETFFDILNEYFEKVFINAEDVGVRKNRLSLLKAIKELYTGDVADLSKIQSTS